MKIADAGGLEAVSMRKVARALDVGTMSLYRYVSSRDDLIDFRNGAKPPPRLSYR